LKSIEVLDASALVAYVTREPGAVVVEALLDDPDTVCYVHAINLCEVYYQSIRTSDEPPAWVVVESILAAGVIVREDMDESLWKIIGQNKARGKISLADCFCLSLAIHIGGRVVTSDHGEFDPLVPLGLCPILFIR
jgi:PIN domain nuclease of toxin-antitoxin system